MGQTTSSFYYTSANTQQKQQDGLHGDHDIHPEEEEGSTVLIRKTNLRTLSIEELKSHVNDFSSKMTKHDVRNAAAEQINNLDDHDNMKYYDDDSWYQQQQQQQQKVDSITIDVKNGTIVENNTKVSKDHDDGESTIIHSHMEVALLILQLSSEIKKLRFQLVPAKLSECLFWQSIFYILETYSPDDLGYLETKESAIDTLKSWKKLKMIMNEKLRSDDKDDDNKIHNNGKKLITSTAAQHQSKPKTTSAQSTVDIRVAMKQKDEELTTLRLQLTKAKNDLFFLQEQQNKLMKQIQSTSTSSSSASTIMNKNNKQRRYHHPGQWKINQECREFLSLDEDVKQKLRDGKQKRLQDVLEQMKFILDSDDVKEAYGKWDCCGQGVYDCSGCTSY